MADELSLTAAFMVGLLGSVHCVGMCGGIVGALTMGLSSRIRESRRHMLPYLLSYNGGRITTYTVMGAVAGAVGGTLTGSEWLVEHKVGAIISGVFMVLLGLYLAGWWRVLVVLEKGGAVLWRSIEPVGRRFLPVRNPLQAYLLGLVWGWLPCGMVYAVLVWSLMSIGAGSGAMLMLAFGLGTLPMLLTMGTAAKWLGVLIRKPLVRQLAGLSVILFGLYTVASVVIPGGDSMHHHHHGEKVPDHRMAWVQSSGPPNIRNTIYSVHLLCVESV